MKYKLSEIGKIVGGGTPSSKHEEYYTPNGIPWLTPKDLSNYTNMYISRGARDITEEGLKKSSAKLLPAKSILVSSRAPIGYVAIANNSISTNQGFKSIVPNTDIVIPEYLYFVMKKSKAALEQVSSGSTFKEVSTKVMSNFEVDIPSIEVQRKILTYLMPISQKIELNKRINDNLAETKSAIFNELFDSKLANGLNGKLQDITDLKTGKRPKSKFNQRDSKAIYPIIGATKVMGFTTDYLYDESVITIGRVGTHGVVQRYREPIWVSDNTFIFLSEHEDYLYELLSHRIKYSSLNVGSTQPLITQSDLKNVDIYVPTKQEFSIFEERTSALTKYQFKLNKQNSTLKALQNSLLDKYF
ncbi:hypothetical protein BTJ26_07350 [Lactobacillus delbrueckii subsp. bulgaricus]|nr:hypothetical protein [Lactobacillus delbrueckii subsp. bulgaricus]